MAPKIVEFSGFNPSSGEIRLSFDGLATDFLMLLAAAADGSACTSCRIVYIDWPATGTAPWFNCVAMRLATQ